MKLILKKISWKSVLLTSGSMFWVSFLKVSEVVSWDAVCCYHIFVSQKGREEEMQCLKLPTHVEHTNIYWLGTVLSTLFSLPVYRKEVINNLSWKEIDFFWNFKNASWLRALWYFIEMGRLNNLLVVSSELGKINKRNFFHSSGMI